MASTRDKNRARALMRANPDLNYTAALRQVQVRTIAVDEAHDVSRLSEATREIIGKHLHRESEVKVLDLGGGIVLDPFDLASDVTGTPSDNDVEHQPVRAASQWMGTPVSMEARETVAYPLPTWSIAPVEERTTIGGPLPVEDEPEE